jgi:hypothetical protein
MCGLSTTECSHHQEQVSSYMHCEKPSSQCLGLMCDESLTWRGLNLNPGYVWLLYLSPMVRLENRVCLSHGVQVAGAARRAATRIVA